MRRENLRSVFILLFLTIAFFFLEVQDGQKYANLFAFDAGAVRAGQAWRLLTYQFVQGGRGFLSLPPAVTLFFSLLLLYLMGSAIEEEWGTGRFVGLFVASTLTSAGVAALLGVPLLGSYFVNFSLLFVYAAMFPQQTFFLFGVIPVRVRWLAYLAAGLLVAGIFAGGMTNVAALAGALVSLAICFAIERPRVRLPRRAAVTAVPEPPPVKEGLPERNATRYASINKAIAAGDAGALERLTSMSRSEIVPGVNICPPVDYKPEGADGYCVRCEGFAECTVRYVKARTGAAAPAVVSPAGSAS